MAEATRRPMKALLRGNWGPAASILLTLVVLALPFLIFLSHYRADVLSRSKSNLEYLLDPHCSALNLAISHRLSVLYGLKAFVESELQGEDVELAEEFPPFAAILRRELAGVCALSLAPDGVHTYVYPMQGNEDLVGRSIFTDKRPDVRESGEQAVVTRRIVVCGPYKLITGGQLGFVGRLAIFAGEAYWGIASASIEIAPLLKDAGFDNLPQLVFAIRGPNGDVFWGPDSVFDNDPVVKKIDISGQFWEIGAHPVAGWDSMVQKEVAPVQAAGALVILLASGIVYLLAARQTGLANAVEARTQELARSRTSLKLRDDMTRGWLSGVHIDEIIVQSVEAIGRSFGRYRVAYSTISSDGHLKVVSSFQPEGMQTSEGAEVNLSAAPDYLDMILRNEAVVINDIRHSPLLQPFCKLLADSGVIAHLAMPVRRWDDVVGVLSLGGPVPRQWSEGEVETLSGISEHLSVIIKEAQTRKERGELESQLMQIQKTESIGRLAAGVAHDFNNLLGPIIGYSELLLCDTGPDHPHRGSLEAIRQSGERAKSLTHQLLAFGRKQLLDVKVVSLNTVLSGFQSMIQRLIREDIRVEISLAPGIGNVRADVTQIEQVVLNLVVNARDAMPSGGTLKIETAEAVLDETYARSRPGVVPGRYVMLAVSDTGCGMDRNTMSRIFDPFFTTKEAGRGTGLGLATVYGIVKQHGGNVWAYSELGRGTTLKVYLPQVDSVESSLSSSIPAAGVLTGTETVLLVEDNQAVREITQAILTTCGYHVMEASSPEDALKIADEHGRPIHLLLTDVIMPGMNGRELYRHMTAMHPETKSLFMSGYTDEVINRHGILEKGLNFISKPFSVQGISKRVREVLDASTSTAGAARDS